MTQDDMVERVEQMLKNDKTIPAKMRNDLMLSLTMQAYRATKMTLGEMKSVREEMEKVRADIGEELTGIRKDVSAATSKAQAEVEAVKKDIETVRKKSIVLWIQENPRLAAFLALALTVLLNVWFDSGVLRSIVAWWLGVPVDLLPN